MRDAETTLDKASINKLSADLAKDILALAAPEELPFLDEAIALQSQNNLKVQRKKDQALGFGLDLSLLTPYVLAIMPSVIQFLGDVVNGAAVSLAQDRLTEWVRGLFRSHPGSAVTPLTASQAHLVREMTYRKAEELGLPSGRASALADAVVGAVLVSE